MLNNLSVEVWQVERGPTARVQLRAAVGGVERAELLVGCLTGRFELWTEDGRGLGVLHSDGSGLAGLRREPMPVDDDEVAEAILQATPAA